jgi:glycogen synthase
MGVKLFSRHAGHRKCSLQISLTLFQDQKIASRLGANAKERSRDFSWENVTANYTRLYERLIAEMGPA